MSISGVMGIIEIGEEPQDQTGQYKKAKAVNGSSFSKHIESAGQLQDESILSAIHLETGESIGIYYDASSTKDNPVVLAKIEGKDGSIKEEKIELTKVDPNYASFVEMLALSAHLKQEGKIDGPAGIFPCTVFASRIKETNECDIYHKENFAALMKDAMDNMMKYGCMDSYLKNLKEYTYYSAISK